MTPNLIRFVAAAGLAAAFVPAQHEEEIIIRAVDAKKAESKAKSKAGGAKLHAALMEAIEKLSDDDLSASQRKKAKKHLLNVVAKLKAHVQKGHAKGEDHDHEVIVIGDEHWGGKGKWVTKGDGAKGEHRGVFVVGEDGLPGNLFKLKKGDKKNSASWVFEGDGAKATAEAHGVFVVGEDGLPHSRVRVKSGDGEGKSGKRMVVVDGDGSEIKRAWVTVDGAKDHDAWFELKSKDHDKWVELKKKAGDKWVELKGKGDGKSKKGGMHFFHDDHGAYVVTKDGAKALAKVRAGDLAKLHAELGKEHHHHHDVILEAHAEIAEQQKRLEEVHAKIAKGKRDLGSRAKELRMRLRKAGDEEHDVLFLEKADGDKARWRFEKANKSYEKAKRALELAERNFKVQQGKGDKKSKEHRVWVEYEMDTRKGGAKGDKKGPVHLFRTIERPAKVGGVFEWRTEKGHEHAEESSESESPESESSESESESSESESEESESEEGEPEEEECEECEEGDEGEEIRAMIEEIRAEMRELRQVVREIHNQLRRSSHSYERREAPGRARVRRASVVGRRRDRETR